MSAIRLLRLKAAQRQARVMIYVIREE